MGHMPTPFILVVDDDPEIVRLLRSYLEQAGFQVASAANGEMAVTLLGRRRPDLLLLDLMLPDRDGWSLTRLIRADAAWRAMPIIMLTARVEDRDKILGLEIGADDYITKPFNPAEVVARVRALLRRAQDSSSGRSPIVQAGGVRLDVGRRQAEVDGQPVELTATEFDLLHVLVDSPGYAFTRSELIERALGYTYEGLERTLDSHIKNLRRKVEPDPRQPTYIETVYGVGYRFVAG